MMPEEFKSHRQPGYHEHIDPGPRAYLPPHTLNDGGNHRLVYPANQVTFGIAGDPATEDTLPCLRLDCLMNNFSLSYVPTAEECCTIAAALIAEADAMEAKAASQASDALTRAMRRGGGGSSG